MKQGVNTARIKNRKPKKRSTGKNKIKDMKSSIEEVEYKPEEIFQEIKQKAKKLKIGEVIQ